MRKVITVDATFLKTIEGGCLIIATAQDPNLHHYPIAFAVVDGEKNESWKWFFTTLKTFIPDSTELVFVSDRNPSLIKAVAEVYPMSKHGYCIWHISHNVKGHVNHGRDEVALLFRKVACLYSEPEFKKQYDDFRERYPSCARYLDKSVEVERWAKCHFPGARYNIDTSNCAESLNAVFEKARRMSLLPMLDTVIEKMSEWFNRHRKDAAEGPSSRKLVPLVENKLHNRTPKGSKLTVTPLNTFQLEYSVIGADGKTYSVDLQHKTCSCRKFDIDKYPCRHAIGAIIKCLKHDRPLQLSDMYDFISKYYFITLWAKAYRRTIYPVPHITHWMVPKEVAAAKCPLPPDYKKRKGRHQEKRHPSAGESRPRPRPNKYIPNRGLASYFNCSQGTEGTE